MEILSSVAKELNLKLSQVENTVNLFDEGATVPFIARYRKEVTGNLDEEQIREVIEKVTYYRNLEKRKEEVIRLIEEQGKLTEELKASITNALKLQEVEDLYLPYKKKKKTKADIAKDQGLEPLSIFALLPKTTMDSLKTEAEKYITEEVPTVEAAIEGVHLIIAQNLSEDIKIKFEDDFNTLQSGISLTIINRTNDKLKSIDKLDTLDNYTPTVLNLSYLTEDECKLLIRNKIALLDNVKLNQIWQITQGNYKDIELIINRLIDNPNSELFNISDIYDKLPDIQKNILIISSIFPAGMRKDIVFNYIKSILDENTEVADSLKSLIDAGFVYINGDTNDKIKISHESIVNGILNHTNASDLQLVTNNLKIYLEQTILSIGIGGELAYLIHCLINICNIEELRQNVEYIKQLLEIEYRKNSYFYIVSLSKKILHLIELLPEKYLHYILNSYQWISDFNGGLAILNSLQKDNYSKDLQLYYPRFQIQKYEFEEALKSLEKLENCSGTLLYKLNAYGHLGKDREAIKLLKESMNSVEKDDFYYIILRNSAHYFPTKEATENLKLALDYFQRNEYQIPVATVYNNLGVVNIWDGEYDIALENLNKATKILKKYDSNEIFEPYCNKSIIFLMNKNYQQSLKFINKSLQECPKALTLDIRMLKLNKLIIELISERISFTEFQNSLRNFEEEIPLIDDPWYKFQIVYNLQQFDDIPFVCEKTYIDDYQDGLTKYYLLIPYKKYNFCIGLSPNWRY